MRFDTYVPMASSAFYLVNPELRERPQGYFFLPTVDLPPAEGLVTSEFEPASLISTNLSVSMVGVGKEVKRPEDAVGFLFYSRLPTKNLFTSLLSYSRSWQLTSMKEDTVLTDAGLVLKTPYFYMYHAPNKATLVTCGSLTEKLHDFLTMI